jgi:two-component system sensor histidine kinase ChvG
VVGLLTLNPFRDSLMQQRETGLITEAQLMAKVLESAFPEGSGADLMRLWPTVAATLAQMAPSPGEEVFVFDSKGRLLARQIGPEGATGRGTEQQTTPISDALNMVWQAVSTALTLGARPPGQPEAEAMARKLMPLALKGQTGVNVGQDEASGSAVFSIATPVRRGTSVLGVLALTSAAGEIYRLVREEREQVLQMFAVALLVSIGLTLVLASTIANPLSDLAAAAELGRDRNARKMARGRVRIPDLAARPDEIGHLSVAMRGMVAALYDRIEANEQFAADVAHEIKNPLASLRSAVGTLRFAGRDDQRQKLMDVIEHDVRRLDRLVSDISNTSRLDSELVREEAAPFDLIRMLDSLCTYLRQQAEAKGVRIITDLPPQPMMTQGLEARLAQVFVNLITNAISFCDQGDAVRLWVRQRENRLLVVVEDTGPGIPEQALGKVLDRFYSERPEGQFGNHSGLGLAISKQIVEAHGGVIWAENIRPGRADAASPPLGARFVVGLPV